MAGHEPKKTEQSSELNGKLNNKKWYQINLRSYVRIGESLFIIRYCSSRQTDEMKKFEIKDIWKIFRSL